ncbi:hypothetical protein MTR67_048908 [Solanum verrucosum]|uniref:Uncharacterized protein n=1 Tax=Solanum verrucosum TaxID=315347 RepID=A0AAF0UYU0_SOLVR|nr:hypothetical protein MTR67_048908 [Solanum verrucosum]
MEMEYLKAEREQLLRVGALGITLRPAVCVDVGATTGVALRPVRPAVYVDVGVAAGPEGGLELGPTTGLELGPAVKLVPEAGFPGIFLIGGGITKMFYDSGHIFIFITG